MQNEIPYWLGGRMNHLHHCYKRKATPWFGDGLLSTVLIVDCTNPSKEIGSGQKSIPFLKKKYDFFPTQKQDMFQSYTLFQVWFGLPRTWFYFLFSVKPLGGRRCHLWHRTPCVAHCWHKRGKWLHWNNWPSLFPLMVNFDDQSNSAGWFPPEQVHGELPERVTTSILKMQEIL